MSNQDWDGNEYKWNNTVNTKIMFSSTVILTFILDIVQLNVERAKEIRTYILWTCSKKMSSSVFLFVGLTKLNYLN